MSPDFIKMCLIGLDLQFNFSFFFLEELSSLSFELFYFNEIKILFFKLIK